MNEYSKQLARCFKPSLLDGGERGKESKSLVLSRRMRHNARVLPVRLKVVRPKPAKFSKLELEETHDNGAREKKGELGR